MIGCVGEGGTCSSFRSPYTHFIVTFNSALFSFPELFSPLKVREAIFSLLFLSFISTAEIVNVFHVSSYFCPVFWNCLKCWNLAGLLSVQEWIIWMNWEQEHFQKQDKGRKLNLLSTEAFITQKEMNFQWHCQLNNKFSLFQETLKLAEKVCPKALFL